MELPGCDRASRCLNFRLDERPPCDGCGGAVQGNHYHDTLRRFRICESCFVTNLAPIAAGSYVPLQQARTESTVCQNHERCFQDEPYGSFAVKVCRVCRLAEPPQHFHDVARNERLCLACYTREGLA